MGVNQEDAVQETDATAVTSNRDVFPSTGNNKNLGNEKAPVAMQAYFLTRISQQGQKLFWRPLLRH